MEVSTWESKPMGAISSNPRLMKPEMSGFSNFSPENKIRSPPFEFSAGDFWGQKSWDPQMPTGKTIPRIVNGQELQFLHPLIDGTTHETRTY